MRALKKAYWSVAPTPLLTPIAILLICASLLSLLTQLIVLILALPGNQYRHLVDWALCDVTVYVPITTKYMHAYCNSAVHLTSIYNVAVHLQKHWRINETHMSTRRLKCQFEGQKLQWCYNRTTTDAPLEFNVNTLRSPTSDMFDITITSPVLVLSLMKYIVFTRSKQRNRCSFWNACCQAICEMTRTHRRSSL